MSHRCNVVLANGWQCKERVADPQQPTCGRHRQADPAVIAPAPPPVTEAPSTLGTPESPFPPHFHACSYYLDSRKKWRCATHENESAQVAMALGAPPCQPPDTADLAWMIANPDIAPQVLRALVNRSLPVVLTTSVSRNPKATARQLMQLPKVVPLCPNATLINILAHPNCPRRIIRRCMRSAKYQRRRYLGRAGLRQDANLLPGVLQRTDLPERTWRRFAHPPWWVRFARVCQEVNITIGYVIAGGRFLGRAPDPLQQWPVQEAVAENPTAPRWILLELAHGAKHDFALIKRLAVHPQISEDDLRRLVTAEPAWAQCTAQATSQSTQEWAQKFIRARTAAESATS